MINLAARLTLCTLLLAACPASAQGPPPTLPPPPIVPGDPQPFLPTAPDPRPAGIGPANEGAGDLARIFATTPSQPLDQAELAGLPSGSPIELLTWERAYQLAWVRAHGGPTARLGVLDPARLAERARELGWADFARFRAEFLATETGRDPAADLLDLQARLLRIAAARGGLALAERWAGLLRELVNGEASGLNLADLDRALAAAASIRREVDRLTAEYRDRLDRLKVALGLSPRASMGLDLAPLAAFNELGDALDRWVTSPSRKLADLGEIVGRLPALGDLVVDGRAILAEVEAGPGRLAEALDLATSFALAHRHDRDEPAEVVELRVRHRVRHLAESREEYAQLRRSLVLAVSQADGAFERIIAPPAFAGADAGAVGRASSDLLAHLRQVAEHRGHVVATWAAFQAELLAAERDLGLAVAADWPSFFGRFQARPGRSSPAKLSRPAREPSAPPAELTPPPPAQD